MTYNVRSMRDDRAALGRVLRGAGADVVLIQEAPRFLRWRSLCAQLARLGGLVVVGGGRPAAANLILSTLRVEVESTADVLFTKDPKLHQRGTAIAVLSVAGSRFAVAGTHLDLKPEPRLRHVTELHAAVDRAVPAGVPTIIGGDMNDVPQTPVWRALTGPRRDAWELAGEGPGYTSSALQPQRRIDALFVDPSTTVSGIRTISGPDVGAASDHLPVVADLEIP
jgi:endonuclease/exonuclease/phosphatase family metal-dependent hydrolase